MPKEKITLNRRLLLSRIFLFPVFTFSTFYFFSGFGFEVGFLKWILIVFLIVGITNSTNLTDGLDGLVAGSSSVSFGGILIISFWIFRHPDYYINFINNASPATFGTTAK